jgi:predicted ArsR family transcriptional regulator
VHDGTPLEEALRECALAAGRELAGTDAELASKEPLEAVCEVLAEHGYEPRAEPDEESGQRVVMANCPFHWLSRSHTELVCGLNADLVTGLTQTLGRGVVSARLEPAPGRCCVVLRAEDRGEPTSAG